MQYSRSYSGLPLDAEEVVYQSDSSPLLIYRTSDNNFTIFEPTRRRAIAWGIGYIDRAIALLRKKEMRAGYSHEEPQQFTAPHVTSGRYGQHMRDMERAYPVAAGTEGIYDRPRGVSGLERAEEILRRFESRETGEERLDDEALGILQRMRESRQGFARSRRPDGPPEQLLISREDRLVDREIIINEIITLMPETEVDFMGGDESVRRFMNKRSYNQLVEYLSKLRVMDS